MSIYLYCILYLFASTHLKNSSSPITDSSSVSALRPFQIRSLTSWLRLQYGSKIGMLYFTEFFMSWSLNHPILSPLQHAMAPSYMDLLLSGTTRSSLMPMIFPSPPQTGHAPSGLLKLKRYSSGLVNSIPSASNLLMNCFITGSSPGTSFLIYKVPSPLSNAESIEA